MKWINLDRWGRLRTKGCWHFVLVRGLLFWGVLMALLYDSLQYWQFTKLASFGVVSRESALATWRHGVLLSFPLWLVAGGAWGLAVWHLSEAAFRRASSRGDHGKAAENA